MDQGPLIVFVCEHGSAKSIVAAAHFNRIAHEAGLAARAVARGTHPDRALSQKAVMGLLADGLAPSEPHPRRLESADIANARLVISFCSLPEEYEQIKPIERWDDVPPVNEDYGRARVAILAHLRRLAIDL